MKCVRDVERIVRDLRHPADAGTHQRILNNLLDVLKQRQRQPAGEPPALRRAIMRSPVTRLAAAAVFLVGGSLLVGLLIHTTPPAYALDQTVTANQQLRTLHMTTFRSGYDDPKEFWLQCSERGQIEKTRWHMPAWDSPQDGAKVVVWKDGKIQIWFKGTERRRPCLATFTQTNAPYWLLEFARKSDPRPSIAQLKEEQARGEVQLEIQEPADKARPIVVTATCPPQDQSPGRRTVLRVNQATKLVTSIEAFALQDGQYALQYRQEFSDYNVPLDPALFDLDGTVPPDVLRADGDAAKATEAKRGLPQGSLSDDEIATEVVRQFFEALIAGDYEKAGQLYCGISAEELRQGFFGKVRILRIVSMDKPTPHPMPEVGGLRVPCKIEIEKDGVKSVWEPFGPFVRTIHRQGEPPRWEIHAGL
jgi:hypothetical protein